MTSKAAYQHGAIRWVAALALTGALVLGSGSSARAESEESQSHDSLQGTWRVQVTIIDCESRIPLSGTPIRSLLSFALGGTVSGVNDESHAFLPGQLTSEYGIWRSTGEHSFWSVRNALILFTSEPNPPRPGFSEGAQRFRETIQVDNDQYTSSATVQFLDVGGNVLRSGCTRSVAHRYK